MSHDVVDLISDDEDDFSTPSPRPPSRSSAPPSSALKLKSIFGDDSDGDCGGSGGTIRRDDSDNGITMTPMPKAQVPAGPAGTPPDSSDEESDEEIRAFRRALFAGNAATSPVATPRRSRAPVDGAGRVTSVVRGSETGLVSVEEEGSERGRVGGEVDERFLDTTGGTDDGPYGEPGEEGLHAGRLGGSKDGDAGKVSAERLRELVRLNGLSSDASVEQSTPAELSVMLLKHQRQALAWMGRREAENQTPGHPRGGILADDQGFGKTLSMIALMLAQRPAREEGVTPAWGNLVVTPTSLMQQWATELEGKIDEVYRPRVLIYHGVNRPRDPYTLVKYDVVLTSYATVVQEYPKVVERNFKREPIRWRKKGPLFRLKWFRVVLDEAQAIKNFRSQSFYACAALKTDRRWSLSGTPIQNTVDDIYAQFVFLRYFVVDSYKQWVRQYKKPLEGSLDLRRRESLFKRFQALVGVVLLRRAKSDKIDGKPVICLPQKNCRTMELRFSKTELAYYQAQEYRAVRDLNKFGIDLGFTNALVILVRLRQCCGHPALCDWGGDREFKFSDDELDYVEERMLTRCMYKSLPPAVQQRLSIELGPGTEVAQSCPICMDLIESEGIVTKCGHIFCASDFEAWHKENDACPSCRTPLGGDEDKMSLVEVRKEIHANHRKQERGDAKAKESSKKRKVKPEPSRRAITICLGGDGTPKSGAGEACNPEGAIGRMLKQSTSVGKRELEANTDIGPPLRKRPRSRGVVDDAPEICEVLSEDEGDNGSDATMESSEAEPNGESKKSSTSTKIKALMSEYKNIVETTDDKALCFSQWTRMLDLIEVRLNEEGFEYVRLDGSMSPDQRSEAIRLFHNRSKCRLFLISLQAGSTGLNLTAANHVFIMDSWWNPAVEQQAIDRVHRIGQKKEVHVTRFKIANSVEDSILALQEKKRAIVEGVLGVEGLKTVGRQRLTMQDVYGLFSDVAENVAARAGNTNDRETVGMAMELLNMSRNAFF